MCCMSNIAAWGERPGGGAILVRHAGEKHVIF